MAIADWSQLHGDFFSGCRVLVTGGAGFIGSHLCEALIELGADVVVIDDLSLGKESNLKEIDSGPGQITFVSSSILDRPALIDCVRGSRFVFHQAGLPSVPRSILDPVQFTEVNVTGTVNVLVEAQRAKVQRVIYAASSSAYGDCPTSPKLEKMLPAPKSPYAANKVAGEHLMRAFACCYDMDTVSLRYFNIFGPRQTTGDYSGVIAIFARQLINGQSATLNGEGYSRDFTFVDNVVQANLLSARSDRPLDGEVINVACGSSVTIKQLALKMGELLCRTDLPPRQGPDRPGDVKHSLADVSRARSLIDYEPIVYFSTGLRATVEWYQQARPWITP